MGNPYDILPPVSPETGRFLVWDCNHPQNSDDVEGPAGVERLQMAQSTQTAELGDVDPLDRQMEECQYADGKFLGLEPNEDGVYRNMWTNGYD